MLAFFKREEIYKKILLYKNKINLCENVNMNIIFPIKIEDNPKVRIEIILFLHCQVLYCLGIKRLVLLYE